ncbi:MAG: ATP-dependent Clp protease proteolytic subunit [Treponemataceae bacterium]
MLIKKIDKTRAEVKFYGNIGGWFTDGYGFSEILEAVEEDGYKDLTIRLHCFGGSVFEGNVIYNALQRSKLNITIVIDGVAASMGCFILPAIENVEICENAFGMVHRPSSFAGGNADDHRNSAKLLDSMETNFAKRISERTGMSEADVRAKWLDGGDHWLNADEMVQYGFASKIVPATAKNIKDLDKEIVVNMGVENVFDRFAAHLNTEIPINKNKKQMDKNALIAAFSLEGVTAESSEADILKAIQAKFAGLQNKITELENAAKAKIEAEINALLNAQPEGSFTDNERATLKEIGEKAGVEALAVALKKTAQSAATVPSIAAMIQDAKGSDAGAVTKDWDWYQKNDPKALEEMPKKNPEAFQKLYKAKYGA